ncbi:hypothetical protein DB88DRAFT_502070 [Papiliotrema laurentii]|uniref:3-dehydrosphinganine reductase n=1 Tax=Papiliotrema laurentii TaxID=5418 RepID=A0AAD9CV28_PAPLA|nr:hypothetical protein DB88DRAFT_502070 [Papiliotrema laurentii]
MVSTSRTMIKSVSSLSYTSIAISLIIVILSTTVMGLFRKKFDPKGKYCYVTGGSTGLGYATAKRLLLQGADIAIVSQNPGRLATAEKSLAELAGPGQKVIAVAADLTKADESERALAEVIQKGGREVDMAFLCAGLSKPKWFLDTTTEELKRELDLSYWIQAWSVHALCRRMASHRVKGTIVMVGSFLGYTSFVGYSSYSSGKYALRGLADSLRNEMLLHDISIHYFAPAGIDTPGNAAEQEFKPAPTKKLEEGDKLQSADECAGHLFRGLERGYYQPTSYFITELMRLSSKGGVPGNNPILDTLYWLGGGIGMPIWVFAMDKIVKGFRKEVQGELEAKGFYKVPEPSRG